MPTGAAPSSTGGALGASDSLIALRMLLLASLGGGSDETAMRLVEEAIAQARNHDRRPQRIELDSDVVVACRREGAVQMIAARDT